MSLPGLDSRVKSVLGGGRGTRRMLGKGGRVVDFRCVWESWPNTLITSSEFET